MTLGTYPLHNHFRYQSYLEAHKGKLTGKFPKKRINKRATSIARSSLSQIPQSHTTRPALLINIDPTTFRKGKEMLESEVLSLGKEPSVFSQSHSKLPQPPTTQRRGLSSFPEVSLNDYQVGKYIPLELETLGSYDHTKGFLPLENEEVSDLTSALTTSFSVVSLQDQTAELYSITLEPLDLPQYPSEFSLQLEEEGSDSSDSYALSPSEITPGSPMQVQIDQESEQNSIEELDSFFSTTEDLGFKQKEGKSALETLDSSTSIGNGKPSPLKKRKQRHLTS